jgi:hypothetical protein
LACILTWCDHFGENFWQNRTAQCFHFLRCKKLVCFLRGCFLRPKVARHVRVFIDLLKGEHFLVSLESNFGGAGCFHVVHSSLAERNGRLVQSFVRRGGLSEHARLLKDVTEIGQAIEGYYLIHMVNSRWEIQLGLNCFYLLYCSWVLCSNLSHIVFIRACLLGSEFSFNDELK